MKAMVSSPVYVLSLGGPFFLAVDTFLLLGWDNIYLLQTSKPKVQPKPATIKNPALHKVLSAQFHPQAWLC